MKKQQGSAHVIIIIILIVAVIAALGFVFWQNFLNKPMTNSVSQTSTSSPASTSTQEETLNSIVSSLNGLSHVEDSTGVTKDLAVTLDSPALKLHLIPEQQVAFYGSVFATSTKYSPPGAAVSASEASAKALDKTAVEKILTDAGLTTSTVDNPSATTTSDRYTSKDVICDVNDSQGFASVDCSTQSEIQRSQTEASSAYATLTKQYPDLVIDQYTSISYYQTADAKYQGILIGAFAGGSLYDAYMVNSSGAGWKYIASSDTTSNPTGPAAPSCSVIDTPYENVFDTYGYCK